MSSAIVTAPPRFGIGAERYDGGIRRRNLVAGLAAVDPGAGLRPVGRCVTLVGHPFRAPWRNREAAPRFLRSKANRHRIEQA
jgi:hypothetical protein